MNPTRLLELTRRRVSRILSDITSCVFVAVIAIAVIGSPKIAQADNAQYFYDPAGRLTGVLDPVNGTAQYTYDQSGNITSIVTNPITTLTVLEFAPNAGPVGTTVTIAFRLVLAMQVHTRQFQACSSFLAAGEAPHGVRSFAGLDG